MEHSGEVTRLLLDLQSGDRSAAEKLLPLVYDELRRLASGIFRRERPDHTLQATALVHEAYLKMADQTHLNWNNRAHFFGIAARAMRQILVDHARGHRAAKRGGGGQKIELNENLNVAAERAPEILSVHEALESLAKLDERKARVVELRYFGGLSGEEIAEVLEISTATVTRELRMAQAWIRSQLDGPAPPA